MNKVRKMTIDEVAGRRAEGAGSMISAWWLIPAFIIGVIAGAVILLMVE